MKFCLSLLLLFSGTLFSQEAPVKHTLRILPLGDPPPFIQEVRNGVRYEVPAEEGTIPPRNIALSAVAPKGEEQEKFPMRLRLGVASTPLEFPLPADRSLEAKLETGGTWLKVPLSKTNSTLALVWRGGKDWFQPRVLTVPDDGKEGDFLFVNVTAKPMAVLWGTEKLKLNPATTMVRRLPDGAGTLELNIQYPAPEGGLKPCFSSQVEKMPGARQQFVIYAADGKEARLPVKVLALSDRL